MDLRSSSRDLPIPPVPGSRFCSKPCTDDYLEANTWGAHEIICRRKHGFIPWLGEYIFNMGKELVVDAGRRLEFVQDRIRTLADGHLP